MAAEEDAKEAKQNSAKPDEQDARADVGDSAPSEGEPDAALEQSLAKATRDGVLPPSEHRDIAPVGSVMSPVQMGTRRFVFAAYFAGAIGIAFILSKAIDLGWQNLEAYSPSIGDPRDEITMPFAALAGVLAAVVALAIHERIRYQASASRQAHSPPPHLKLGAHRGEHKS